MERFSSLSCPLPGIFEKLSNKSVSFAVRKVADTLMSTLSVTVPQNSLIPYNILIADDTLLLRSLLVAQLTQEEDLQVVGEAGDGREAVEMAIRLRPDLILMDLDMPHLNGIQATERILARLPHIKIVMLTAHEGLARIGKLVGASDCLEKNCSPQELLGVIRRARLKAHTPPSPSHSSNIAHHEEMLERIALRASLTEREQRTLRKAIQTELTVEQIANALTLESGQDCTISSVKHSLDRVLTKLRIEPRTRASLVRYVLEFEQKQPTEE